MAALLRYLLEDGTINGKWESNQLDILEAQIVPDDPVHGYRLDTSGLDFEVLQAGYVMAGETVTPKPRLTLSATPPSFPADGVSECRVAVVPFVPCRLRVGQETYALTVEDPVLVLTADAPWRFQVSLEPMATGYAAPIEVEAQ